jgi:hypothetical protein
MIVSGHKDGKVIIYKKDDEKGYEIPCLVKKGEIHNIKVSKYTDHIVIRSQDKLILFDVKKNLEIREFFGKRFDFTEQYLFA